MPMKKVRSECPKYLLELLIPAASLPNKVAGGGMREVMGYDPFRVGIKAPEYRATANAGAINPRAQCATGQNPLAPCGTALYHRCPLSRSCFNLPAQMITPRSRT